MNRKPKAIVAAVAMALAGTLLLAFYVKGAEARATSGDDLVPVLVVTDKIEAGTPASDVAGKVTTQQVPVKVRPEGAVTDLDALKSKVAAIDLLPGEQLTSSRFVAAADLHKATAPPGTLEVTVQLDPARALGGAIVPGDQVAVIASLDDAGDGNPATHLILQHVTVTRVSSTEPMPEQKKDAAIDLAPGGSMLVTLAVDAASAEKVIFAAEQGRLWLSAQAPDVEGKGTVVQTKASVFK
jgi:pilus assembly protein CpaB